MNRTQVFFFLLAATALSVLFQGFDLGVGNNQIELLILNHSSNPSLYPDDPFVETLTNYFSIFWWALSLITWVQDWYPLFLVLHIASRFFLLYVIYSWFLVLMPRNNLVSLFSTLIFGLLPTLMRDTMLGRGSLLLFYLEHSSLSLALLLWAFKLSYSRKFFSSAVVCGFAFDMNPFYGAWSITILFFMYLFSFRHYSWSKQALLLAKLLCAFVIASLPSVLWIFSTLVSKQEPIDLFNHIQYLKEYFPNHFLISSAEPTDVVGFISMMISGLLGLFLLPRKRNTLIVMYFSAIGLIIVGVFLPFITQSRIVLNLHLLRVDTLIQFFSVMFITSACVQKLLKPENHGIDNSVAFISLLGMIVGNWIVVMVGALFLFDMNRITFKIISGILLFSTAAALVCFGLPAFAHYRLLTGLFVVFLMILTAKKEVRVAGPFSMFVVASYCKVSWLAAVAIIVIYVWLTFGDSKSKSLRIGSLACLLACGVFLSVSIDNISSSILLVLSSFTLIMEIYFAFFDSIEVKRGKTPYFVMAVLVGIVSINTIENVGMRLRKGHYLSNLSEKDMAWRDVQFWAKTQTNPDDVFMVPLKQPGFPVFSKRSVWVDFKQGAAVMWAPKYYWAWHKRLHEQRELTNVDMKVDYCMANKIDYIVVPIDSLDKNISCVYQNKSFAVIKASDRSGSS